MEPTTTNGEGDVVRPTTTTPAQPVRVETIPQPVGPPTPAASVLPAAQVARQPIPLSPDNFDDVWRMAVQLARSELLPPSLRNKPENVAVVMMTGRDLGLSAMQAIRGVHVVEGRPTFSADLMAALVWGSGKCERLDIVESTSEICRVVAQRKGGVAFEAKFTMAEARNIKYGRENRILAEKDNYRNYGVDMLRARATARACRAVFPDILFGCYIPDEIEETIVPTEPRGPPKGEKRRGFARDLSETMPIEPAPKPAEVVVDRSTSQEVVEESNGEVESTTVAEINGETKVKIVDTSTVAELLDADKARRAELIGFITEGSKKFNPEEIEAIFAEAKVSFDIESYDVLSTPQLVALSNSQTIAMARKIAPTMKASALPQPAAKEPEESTLMRDCRIIGLARRENPETFRKAFDKLKYDPKMPASTLSKVQRDAVIREIYGDKPPL